MSKRERERTGAAELGHPLPPMCTILNSFIKMFEITMRRIRGLVKLLLVRCETSILFV